MSEQKELRTLVIIDVQNDFTPGGSLEVEDGDLVVPVINQIMKKFDLVVATQDWHPQNHASFASNHDGKQAFETIDLNGMEQTLWPDHCVQGSVGAEIHPDLDIRRVEAIFRKGTDPQIDSYSAFFDNGHLKRTGLAGYLREKGAHELYFCGLAADICVYFTIRDALQEGFSATLIEDAAKPLQHKKYREIKEELLKDGVQVIQSDAILTG